MRPRRAAFNASPLRPRGVCVDAAVAPRRRSGDVVTVRLLRRGDVVVRCRGRRAAPRRLRRGDAMGTH